MYVIMLAVLRKEAVYMGYVISFITGTLGSAKVRLCWHSTNMKLPGLPHKEVVLIPKEELQSSVMMSPPAEVCGESIMVSLNGGG